MSWQKQGPLHPLNISSLRRGMGWQGGVSQALLRRLRLVNPSMKVRIMDVSPCISLGFPYLFKQRRGGGNQGFPMEDEHTRHKSAVKRDRDNICSSKRKKRNWPKKRKPTTPPPGIAHPPAARDPCRPIQRVSWPRQKKARQASPPANRPVQSIPVCNLRVGWLGGGSRTCRNPPFRAIAHSHTLPSGLTLHSRGCCWFFLQFGPFKSCR